MPLRNKGTEISMQACLSASGMTWCARRCCSYIPRPKIFHVYIMRTVLQGKKGRSHAAKALQRMVYGAGSLGFDMKLNVAVALGLIKPSLREQLMELNSIRNK